MKKAQTAIGLKGLNIGRTEGFARDRTRKQAVRGAAAYDVDVVRMTTVETAIEDGLVESAIQAISVAARTSLSGDGRIFISDIAHAVNIRNGEAGVAAISRKPSGQERRAA